MFDRKILAFLSLFVFLAASCGNAEPVPDLSGIWSGSFTDNVNSTQFTMTLNLVQEADNSVTGTINLDLYSNYSEVYAFTGDFDGQTLHFREPDGRYFSASVDGQSMTGSVSWDAYAPDFAWGQFSLSRIAIESGSTSITPDMGAATEPPYPAATHGTLTLLNLSEGGSVTGSLDDHGRALVPVQVQVTDALVSVINLVVDDLPQLDEVMNSDNEQPFTSEISWHPMNGGGNYTVKVIAMLNDKSVLEQTVHITVTGIPVFTPTAPPPDMAGAQQIISDLILSQHGVSIPKPIVYRFEDPLHPTISRWISATWYNGKFYFINRFDDGHTSGGNGVYTDNTRKSSDLSWVLCKPVGHFKILVLFVDYTGTMTDPQAAIAKVPVVAAWLNNLYSTFTTNQGISQPLLTVEAEGVYVGLPPTPGSLLTAEQILHITGKDAANFDILMEIDNDPNFTFAAQNFPSDMNNAGMGLALQGCGKPGFGAVHIWSSLDSPDNVEGALIMDFNHEFSHVFGLSDDWPTPPDFIYSPSGQPVNDWIPYPMFGWTDTDDDGVIEILDPTPYGTSGPMP